jgi:hypothetical protein
VPEGGGGVSIHSLPLCVGKSATGIARHTTLLADPHAAVLCYTAISDKGGNIRLLAVEPDFYVCGFVLIGALLTLPNRARADWWIVRASDGKCVVVDIEPTGKDKDVTRVGEDVYQTPDQAEVDVKRLCKESKPAEPK